MCASVLQWWGTSVWCSLQSVTTRASGTRLLLLELACLTSGWFEVTPTSGRSPPKTRSVRTPILHHLMCWGVGSHSTSSDPHLLLRPSKFCWVPKSWRKSLAITFSLGGTDEHQSFSPKLPGRLTWRRRRERRNLKTPFPLSEQWAGNQSACQLLRWSCQAVVLLCRPGSTNYTFVFSPGPALLLPQLNTLKQRLLQLWELSWESGESQQPIDEGPTEKSGGYKPHGEGKLLPVVDRKQSIWYPDGWKKICRKEIDQLVEDGDLWMDFQVAWPQPPTLLQQDAVSSTVGIRTDIHHSLLAQASPLPPDQRPLTLSISLSLSCGHLYNLSKWPVTRVQPASSTRHKETLVPVEIKLRCWKHFAFSAHRSDSGHCRELEWTPGERV